MRDPANFFAGLKIAPSPRKKFLSLDTAAGGAAARPIGSWYRSGGGHRCPSAGGQPVGFSEPHIRSAPEEIEVSGIGLLNEKPLHASLKKWYAQPGDRFEVAIEGFVIDIVRGDLLLEIQTANFASIKSKLAKLVRSHQIRLIYPIALEKWIVRLAKDGSSGSTRRKSPKRGQVEDVFRELVSIPQLFSNRNLSLEVLMIREEEVRRYQGMRNWRRKGWGIQERRLLEVVDQRLFEESADWLALLPQGLESFTARDLAEAMDIRRELAQKMTYFLRKLRAVELIGRQGRANLYRVAGA